MNRRLKTVDLFKMLFRCFLIQGSWNFKVLIGTGFCFCALPITRRLSETTEDQKEFLYQHLTFFNAHPYFASWCLGAVAKLEEEAAADNWESKQIIAQFKKTLTGPLGSIGDRIFWNGVKPLASGIGLILALLIGWYAVIVFLVLYNIPHFYFRIKGLFVGYKNGFDIVTIISEKPYRRFIVFLSILGAVAAGIYAILACKWSYDQNHYLAVAFAVSVLTTLVFLDLNKPVWISLVFSVIFSIVVKIIFFFTV